MKIQKLPHIILTLLLILSNQSFAQGSASHNSFPETGRKTGFYLGVKYMPFFSNTTFYDADQAQAVQNRLLCHGWGASLNYYLNPWVGVHIEAINQKQQFELLQTPPIQYIYINNINVPLLLSINSHMGKAINLHLAGGPYMGLNSNYYIENHTENNGTYQGAEGILAVKPMDFGLSYGAGLDFGFGPNHWLYLNLGFRGNIGLTKINEQGIWMEGHQFSLLGESSKYRTNGAYVGLMAKF